MATKSYKYEATGFAAFLLIALLAAAAYGWVENLIKLFSMTTVDHVGMLVARIIGVGIPIIGAVLGWF